MLRSFGRDFYGIKGFKTGDINRFFRALFWILLIVLKDMLNFLSLKVDLEE